MTPKEKAEELVYFFRMRTEFSSITAAKECALKVCDEVLDKDGYNNDYWQEVKTEIEQL
jgi:hypothetical protein